jgi:hypothetical protein
MASKFAPAFLAAAHSAGLGLLGNRTLTNETRRSVETLKAIGAAEGVARIVGGVFELRAAARVAAAMA